MPDIATLGLRVDANGAITELRNFDRALDNTAGKGERLSKTIATGLGLSVIGGAIATIHKVVQETSEAQKSMAQLEAVVKSTGATAGFTVKQLDDMSAALQKTTVYSDEAVQGAEAVLLGFRKLKGPEFTTALQLVTDISARLGGDLTQNALKVGRALEDPIRGMRALSSIGITFSNVDREMIKHLVEGGREIEARRIIVERLKSTYEGAAEAAKNTLPGALQGLKNAFGELFEETEANTRANVRLINSFTRLLEKIKEIRAANVARLNPEDPLDYFRKNPTGKEQRLLPNGTYAPAYSGGTTTISAAPPSQDEIEKMEKARRDAIEARKKAEREYYDEIEENARFARQQEEQWAERFKDILIQHAQDILDLRAAYDKALGIRDVGTRAVKDLDNRGLFDNLVDPKILQRFTGHIGDLDAKTAKLVQTFSQAAEYFLVSKAGGGFGSSLGAAAAKGAFQDSVKGGFASTALGGAIFNPLIAGAGAIIGKGFDAFISDVFGGAAKRRAKEAFQKATEDFARSIASQKAIISGNSLEASIIDVQQEYAERRKKAEELNKVTAPSFTEARKRQEEARARVLDELNRLEAERIRILKEEDEERKRYAKEDLEVRALRAQGRDKEADRLALENRQRQELFDAITNGMSAEYIERLKQVQALERSKEALDELSKSALNLVQGYRYQGTIFKNAPITAGIPLPIPFSPEKPSFPDGDLVVPINIDGDKIGEVVIKDFRKRSQRKFGTTTRWSELN